MVRRRVRVGRKGFHKYHGDARAICAAIVHECYESHHGYYRVSIGNYCEFWVRDFAWCVAPLIRLGHSREVVHTLEYALGVFAREGAVTTTISPDGRPFDFPVYAVDSLPLLLFTIAEAQRLVTDSAIKQQLRDILFAYAPFLDMQVAVFREKVVGNGGLVRPGHFSSMKDHSARLHSCYDQAMIALLDHCIKLLGLRERLPVHDYKAILLEHFWKDDHFVDALGSSVISGDANIVPFWCGVVSDVHMFKRMVARIEREGLCDPLPLRYTRRKQDHHGVWQSFFAPNYEGDTVWAHMGMMYLDVLARHDPERARIALAQYARKIEEHKTFLELYEGNGKPYKSLVYMADESMLWCANWLDVEERLH